MHRFLLSSIHHIQENDIDVLVDIFLYLLLYHLVKQLMFFVNRRYIHVTTYILILSDTMLENDAVRIIKDLFDLIVHIYQVPVHRDVQDEMEKIITHHDLFKNKRIRQRKKIDC